MSSMRSNELEHMAELPKVQEYSCAGHEGQDETEFDEKPRYTAHPSPRQSEKASRRKPVEKNEYKCRSTKREQRRR